MRRGPGGELHLQEASPATSVPAFVEHGGLVAVLGTELRNSVTPLCLLVEQIQHELHAPDAGVPDLGAHLDALRRHLDVLVGKVDRVVDVARLSEGEIQLAIADVELGDVVGRVCVSFARQVAASGSELSIDAPEPVRGRWDAARVAQIVRDLLSNAIRYGAGPIEIVVRRRGGTAELIVRDHGPGFAPAALARAFDRFERPRRRGAGGLGVGLWMVRVLCEAMGGSVRVDRPDGGGARFCVLLPCG